MNTANNNDTNNLLLRFKEIIQKTTSMSFLQRTNVLRYESQQKRQKQRTIQQLKIFFRWFGRTILKMIIENKFGLRMKRIQFKQLSSDDSEDDISQIEIDIEPLEIRPQELRLELNLQLNLILITT